MKKKQIDNRTLFTGDNLDVMRAMNSESVDLIYLDPPFNKKFVFPIGKGKEAEFGFTDIWGFGKGKDDPYLLETELNAYNELMWAELFGSPTIGKADAETLLEFVKVSGKIGGESAAAYLSFMAIRLLEMKRILKPTGSIYLHCDHTIGHSIKSLMDIVFGQKNFRNEIVWAYTGPGSPKMRQFNRKHDVVFWYNKGDEWVFNRDKIRVPYKDPKQTLRRAFDAGSGIGSEEVEKYRARGKVLEDWWTGIALAVRSPHENTKYPTQKPVALLERIILASSNEGDLILDPFCGCATTCIAAERLGRHWVGIDVAKQAANLVKKRLNDETEQGKLGDKVPRVHHCDFTDVESRFLRTDIKGLRSPDRVIRVKLYGIQSGNCVLCKTHFDHHRHFHLDHKQPKAKGGPDIDVNLQLLCGNCNSIKGDGTMAEARKRLQKWGYVT